jgi:hypothetical protein
MFYYIELHRINWGNNYDFSEGEPHLINVDKVVRVTPYKNKPFIMDLNGVTVYFSDRDSERYIESYEAVKEMLDG